MAAILNQSEITILGYSVTCSQNFMKIGEIVCSYFYARKVMVFMLIDPNLLRKERVCICQAM